MARKTRIFVGLVGFVVAKGLFNREILPSRRDAATLRKTVEPRRARETEDGGGDWNHERSPSAFPIFHHSTIPVFQTSDAPSRSRRLPAAEYRSSARISPARNWVWWPGTALGLLSPGPGILLFGPTALPRRRLSVFFLQESQIQVIIPLGVAGTCRAPRGRQLGSLRGVFCPDEDGTKRREDSAIGSRGCI
jgi:hypothetical protein